MKTTSLFLQQLGFTRPGILVNEAQAKANIRAMADKAKRAGAIFRPHFKTHQSADVGQWFADEGVQCITVSSVEMAEYFADHGWHDITIAFLLNPLEWPRIEPLARKLETSGGRLGLTVDSLAAAAFVASRLDVRVQIWIKVDAGYGRTGVHWQDAETIKLIADQLKATHGIAGLLTHSGDSYHAASGKEILDIWNRTRERLEDIVHQLEMPQLIISVGDTPGCRSVNDLSGVQEIRPGNFIFFDLMQWSQGVCETHELATAAVCPVVGLYPKRGHIVVHGGAVHLSRECLTDDRGTMVFGYLGTMTSNSDGSTSQQVLKHFPMTSLSQEHGVIEITDNNLGIFENLELGDLVLIWPVHSCLTCDLSREYKTISSSILKKF